MAMGRIFINGKEITKKEFYEICKQERKDRIQQFIEKKNTKKQYVYDNKVFEDIGIIEEYAKENFYTFEEEELLEISKTDIIKYAYDEDDIITIDKWEEEHQLEAKYDNSNYIAYLAEITYQEIHKKLI